MSDQSYEFSAQENRAIQPLASRMMVVGTILMVFGFIRGGIAALVLNFPGMIEGLLTILIGTWTQRAALSFRRIVTTEGNDIPNLMTALGQLLKLYTLQLWVYIIIAVTFVVFSILALIGLLPAPG